MTLVIYINSFNISIARTIQTQINSGYFVYRHALKVADLLFFKTSWRARRVGFYMGGSQFLHTSTSQGVMISSLDNVYWKGKYWQGRRFID